VIECPTKFADRKPKRADGSIGFQLVLYVPKAVAMDSQFPFRPGEEVLVKIEAGRLVVSKYGR
jgi:hypothetical protein